MECSKCGRVFECARGEHEVCPDCINREFAVAARLHQSEVETLRIRNASAAKRQNARMLRIQEFYRNGAAFNMGGKIMLCVGLFLFMFCHLLFMLDGLGYISWGVDSLDMESKGVIGLVISSIAGGLLLMSTRRYKLLMFCVCVCVVASGWWAPEFWKPENKRVQTKSPLQSVVKNPDAAEGETADISDEELSLYYDHCKKYPRATHYAVFMDNQDPSVRVIVRDVLTRLAEAESTRAHTCMNGVLYVISNAAGTRRNISDLLTRFGRIVSSNVKDGLYLIRFDAEKTQLVSRFSGEVLSSPLHTSFVTANISELGCLDPMRIRVAARSLKNANVQVLRRDIRDALVAVLQEPWGSDQDTYEALIDALVTYADSRDKEALPLCFAYLKARTQLNRQVLPSVVDYLIKEDPDKMVEPVVQLWLSNPLAWEQALSQMAWRVQPKLVQHLQSGQASIQEINSIFRFLQSNGTQDAIPAVKAQLEHSDSFVRYSARELLKVLETR